MLLCHLLTMGPWVMCSFLKPVLLPKPHGHFRHQLTASSKLSYEVLYVYPSMHPSVKSACLWIPPKYPSLTRTLLVTLSEGLRGPKKSLLRWEFFKDPGWFPHIIWLSLQHTSFPLFSTPFLPGENKTKFSHFLWSHQTYWFFYFALLFLFNFMLSVFSHINKTLWTFLMCIYSIILEYIIFLISNILNIKMFLVLLQIWSEVNTSFEYIFVHI